MDRIIRRRVCPDTHHIQLGSDGELVLPKALCERYNLQPGDPVTLLDIGSVFILRPQRSAIDAVADEIKGMLEEVDETQESMLRTLREERNRHIGQR
jgi:bifunctional DNA-binding transcriptional regulator/antitoxin component of YhaV-PrlF toxin-antitoxin module